MSLIKPGGASGILKVLNKPMITFRFDDGFLSDYTKVFPLFKLYGIRGTFYIISGYVGNNPQTYMTAPQIKEMSDAGQEIGSHTRDHVDLTGLTDEQVITQAITSKKSIEEITNKEVKSLAVPFSIYNDQVLKLLGGSYEAVTTRKTSYHSYGNVNKLDLGSCFVDGPTRGYAYAIDQINEAVAAGGWLIIGMHEIVDAPKPVADYKVNYEDFVNIVSYVSSLSAQVDIVPFSEGARRIIQPTYSLE